MVENKTGAAGRIDVDAVKAAAPDGVTSLLTPYSMMAIYQHIYKQLSYNPFTDLMPVCMASSLVHGLAVGPLVPATVKSVKDDLTWAKSNPKDASYGSPAAGFTPHFLGALPGLNKGVELKHIPYRGSTPGVVDLIGRQLASMLTPHGDFLANHKAGKLRILTTSGKQRSPFVPEIFTFTESGFTDLVGEECFSFYAPAKTPANIVASANAAINAALKEKSVIDSLAIQGMLPVGGTAAQMAADQKVQFDAWGPIVKKSVLPLRPDVPASQSFVAAPQTVGVIDANYLQTLLGYNARRVSLQVIELVNQRMAEYELSPVDFSVLSLIGRNPGITSRQLCSALNLLPPNLVGKISVMEKRDLLVRQPLPDDRRAIGLYLTTAGDQLMTHAEKTATSLEADITSKLTDAEVKTLLHLLQKVYL